MDTSSMQLVKKLPDLYIDHKPEDNPSETGATLMLNIFNPSTAKKAQREPQQCSNSLI